MPLANQILRDLRYIHRYYNKRCQAFIEYYEDYQAFMIKTKVMPHIGHWTYCWYDISTMSDYRIPSLLDNISYVWKDISKGYARGTTFQKVLWKKIANY